MVGFLRKHALAVIFSLVAGVILVLPGVFLPLSLGDSYQGVAPYLLDDEDIYRARIAEVLDGHPGVSSPYFHEYKESSRTIVPPIGEWIYALPASLIGLSSAIILMKFLLPAALFFLVYLLVSRLTKGDSEASLLAALSAAALVVLGGDLVDHSRMAAILHGESGVKGMLWERTVNPIVGAVMLFLYLVFVHRALEGGKRAKYVAGAILALMVGYFFSFALGYTILGALILLSLLRLDLARIRSLLVIAAFSLFLDIPYWVAMFRSVGGEGGREFAARNGMSFTHEPVINKLLLASSLVFFALYLFVYALRKEKDSEREWHFAAALLLGTWIAFNQQVITGREVWFHHFVQYATPLSFVALVVAGHYSVRPKFPRLWRAGSLALIALSFAYATFTSVAGALPYRAELIRQQSFAPVFSFLRERAIPGCTVLVLEERESLERVVPAYTSCDVYSSTYVFLGVPLERVVHNLYIKMRLEGVSSSDVDEYLMTHEDEVRHVAFDDWGTLFSRGEEPWLAAARERLALGYRESLKEDLEKALFRYRLDVIVADRPLPEETLAALPRVTLATATPAYHLYLSNHDTAP